MKCRNIPHLQRQSEKTPQYLTYSSSFCLAAIVQISCSEVPCASPTKIKIKAIYQLKFLNVVGKKNGNELEKKLYFRKVHQNRPNRPSTPKWTEVGRINNSRQKWTE